MQTFKLDLFSDIHFDGNMNVVMVDGIDEKTQSLKNLLMCRMGEWFLNTKHGLDYFAFLGERFDRRQEIIRAVFMDCLEQEKRITRVDNLELEFNNETREMRVDFRVIMDGQMVADSLEVTA